jgi:hypothetical protein
VFADLPQTLFFVFFALGTSLGTSLGTRLIAFTERFKKVKTSQDQCTRPGPAFKVLMSRY